MNKDIQFTKHASNMLKERKLTRKLIIDSIKTPDFREDGDGGIWYAIKKVGPRFLRVVISGKKKPYKVVTIYYDRRLRILNGKKETKK
ncbi:MAG: DUF4258 domain-containing protein [Candidatus Thermoplasmatota archaeon]|nr:DUF4258 domain-containing protein [Euryarchaeota archaeon]MBU4032665.1 DUF4258 domain-containing protein [Candidatus Thermoplasmatota archaeon]MBU4071079.1 DUF4258 domain-containing protein [Candidatus Thermoplasmatota archaeon]MBU4145182.1 DUF4258 domain-containing protein [Candidatus Thermoplasmatota archaeon]MBU4591133.1 DUF4258 domain-containing protein [Candidatus Thermoplasmatota archaeon]